MLGHPQDGTVTRRVLRGAACCAVAAMIAMASPRRCLAVSFVTFESGPVRPMAMTPDGSRLLVVNTPDARLELFEVNALGIVHSGSVPVGMEPVAVAVLNNGEAWVVNQLSDSVSGMPSRSSRRRRNMRRPVAPGA